MLREHVSKPHNVTRDADAKSRRSGVGAIKATAAGALMSAAVMSHGAVARAEPPPPAGWLSKWPVSDEDPASSIPTDKEKNSDPLQFGYWIQDLIAKAEHASKRGDHAASAKLWDALGIAVPDRAVAFGKACEQYEALADYDKAIDACGHALLRDGLTVSDYTRFVRVVLAKPGPLAPKETIALRQVIDHMKAADAGRAAAVDLECEVAVRTSNVAELRECTTALRATAPDDAKTISYRWALALLENDFGQARKLIDDAKASGIDPVGLENMQRATSEDARYYWRRILLWLACFALLLGAAGVSARTVSARRRSAQLAA